MADKTTVTVTKDTLEKIERLLPAARSVTGIKLGKIDLVRLAVDRYGEWLGRKVKKD